MHSLWHIGTHGVRDCHHAEEVQAFGYNFLIHNGDIAFIEHLISKTKRAHGLALIAEELCVEGGFVHIARGGGTKSVHDFGSPFHIEHFFTRENSRLHDGRHVFAFSGEGQFFEGGGVATQGAIVFALTVQPEEDSPFGGIAQDTGLFARKVERGCAVHRHSFGDEATFV